MVIKAALLDEQGVYLRMDELESEAQLTARHVPAIKECDLPPGRFKWVPGENAYGGEFVDVEAIARRNRPDFDEAFRGLCETVQAQGIELPAKTRIWLDHSMKRSTRRRARVKGRG
jgi:hypothetical protein